MKNLDDGPDGLNDAAFEQALRGGRRKRARKPKPLTKPDLPRADEVS